MESSRRRSMLKRLALVILVLVLVGGFVTLAIPRTPSIDVETTFFPESTPDPTHRTGEKHAWIGQSRSSVLGYVTSKNLDCTAVSRDPGVTGFRMELFRVVPEAPVLVARTGLLPATGRHSFEFDIRKEPIGQEFLLRVTFHRADGTTEVLEEQVTIESP